MTEKMKVHPADVKHVDDEEPKVDDDPKKKEGEPAPGEDPKTEDTKRFTQAELDFHIKSRLERQAESLKTQAEKDAKKAMEKELKEQSKFQELADSRQEALEATADELETAQEDLKESAKELKAYKGILESQLVKRTEGLPKLVRDLLEGKSALEQIQYLDTNAEELSAYSKENSAQSIPIPGTPSGSPGKGKTEQERKKASISARQYI